MNLGSFVKAGALAVMLALAGNGELAAEQNGSGRVYTLDHLSSSNNFKCYEVDKSSKTRFGRIDLEDDFTVFPETGVRIGKPRLFCNPAVKDQDNEAARPDVHLTCYDITSRRQKRTVEIENDFGTQTLVTDKAELFCLPGTTLGVSSGDHLKKKGRKGKKRGHDHRKHDNNPPVSTKILLSSSETVLGQLIDYPTGSQAHITSAIVTLQPGAETGLHLHEVPLFGFLLEGELTITYETGFVKVLRPGDSLLEAMRIPHNGRNTSKGVARIFVVFAGAEGVPNTVSLE